MSLIIGAIAIINAIGYLAVTYAFRASFRELNSATWWFATGFAILAGTIVLRGLYWDVTLPLMRYWTPEFAEWWVEAVSGRMINIVFSIMKMSVIYCALRCRQMLIPESERHLWPWYAAWLHPHCIRILTRR